MKNNQIYQKLKKATSAYTVTQAEALTDSSIRSLVTAASDCTGTFVNNMKVLLIEELQAKRNEIDDARIKSVLDAGFPEWKNTERGREINSRLSAAEVIK